LKINTKGLRSLTYYAHFFQTPLCDSITHNSSFGWQWWIG